MLQLFLGLESVIKSSGFTAPPLIPHHAGATHTHTQINADTHDIIAQAAKLIYYGITVM